MKLLMVFLLTLTLISSAKEEYNLAFVTRVDLCDTCIEPFMAPSFKMNIVKGPWPEKPGVMRCRTFTRDSETQSHFFCENGLELSINTIRFKK